MTVQMFLRQLSRGKNRAFAVVLLLCVTTGFFAMSVNLYQSSTGNLALAEETFSTIAVMELYGDIDQWGRLTEPGAEDYQGYFSVAVDGYDLSPVVAAAGIDGYDLRSRYAACLTGQPTPGVRDTYLYRADHIRFRIAGESPVALPVQPAENAIYGASYTRVPVEEVAGAAGLYVYGQQLDIALALTAGEQSRFAQAIQQLNGGGDPEYVLLMPGTEYYATGSISRGTDGVYQIYLSADDYGRDYHRRYFRGVESILAKPDSAEQPFFLQKWEDIAADPDRTAYTARSDEALQYTLCSYPVTLTDDIMGIPAFHLGGALLKDGRYITLEEYGSGAKVCMVSQQLAQRKGWSVGDRLELRFYQPDAYPHDDLLVGGKPPFYSQNVTGFFDQGEYEIVGLYTSRELTGNSLVAESTMVQPWINIYMPKNAVNTPVPENELPVHGNLLTLRLKNGSVNAFLDDITARGVLDAKDGDYQPRFTFYDQGYSLIQPGLEAMQGMSKLLLGLSAALLVATVILLAYFFAQSQKHSVGIFRMLGGGKASAFTAVLICALILTLFGAAAGGLIGHSLSGIVGQRILTENLAQSKEAAEFSAYLLAGGEPEIQLSAAADISATLFSAGAGAALFLLLTAVFTLSYLPKEPRALLPSGAE